MKKSKSKTGMVIQHGEKFLCYNYVTMKPYWGSLADACIYDAGYYDKPDLIEWPRLYSATREECKLVKVTVTTTVKTEP